MPAYRGEYEDVLRPFFDAMRYKLVANKHKGRSWRDMTLEELFKMARREIDELEEAISLGNTTEIMLESADVGNLAMMISNVALLVASKGGNSEDGRRNTVAVSDESARRNALAAQGLNVPPGSHRFLGLREDRPPLCACTGLWDDGTGYWCCNQTAEKRVPA